MYRAAILAFALLSTPALAAAQQQPCTTDARRVVNELYRHMLERQPDAGSANWVQELQSGRLTVREVVRQIANSEEHTRRFLQADTTDEGPAYDRSIAGLYRHILGRQPDAGGQRVHADFARRQGINATIDRIVDSNEYDQQFGDWGVPGSGGLRLCPPGTRAARRAAAVVPPEQRRFRGMDANNDGVISRTEWRGSAQSFNVHDWDNDDVLSGDEVNESSARTGYEVDDMSYDLLDSFEYLDVNNNDRVDAREWHGTVAAFNRLDVNNDDVLSRQEILAYRGTPRSLTPRAPVR